MNRKLWLTALLVSISLLVPVLPVLASDTVELYTEDDLRTKITADADGNFSGSYKLMSNITLTAPWNDIGSSIHPFTGTFDGNGKTISGLYVYSKYNNRGFFGYASHAVVRDLTLEGSVTGYTYAGGFIGRANDCSLSGCTSRVTVTADSGAGGLLGFALGCTVVNCRNEGPVSAATNAGGIAGYALPYDSASADSLFTGCYNSGAITPGEGFGGGILGSCATMRSSVFGNITVSDCYNLGTLDSTSREATLGGIIGNAIVSSRGNITVTTSYNAGFLTDTNNSGAILGSGTVSAVSLQNCFYLDNFSRIHYADTASAGMRTASDMAQSGTYTGFDFTSVWEISGSYPYPHLQKLPMPFERRAMSLTVQTAPTQSVYTLTSAPSAVSTAGMELAMRYNDGTTEIHKSGFAAGACDFHKGVNVIPVSVGTLSTFFCITVYSSAEEKNQLPAGYLPLYSARNLSDITVMPDKNYILMNDIDASSLTAPACAEGVPFSGILLGSDHTVSGLSLSQDATCGLFAALQGATVKNLSITGSVSSLNNAGLLAGEATNTSFDSCHASGTVTGAENAGALAGVFRLSEASRTLSVEQCTGSGTITVNKAASGSCAAGGLLGAVQLENGASFSFTGNSSTASVSITSVTAIAHAGGLLGLLEAAGTNAAASISSCASAGSVCVFGKGAMLLAGGILGDAQIRSQAAFRVENCFSLSPVQVKGETGTSAWAGGILSQVDKAYAPYLSVQNCYAAADVSITDCSAAYCGAVTGSAPGVLPGCYYPDFLPEDTSASARTDDQMRLAATFEGFDFDSVWELSSYRYPTLRRCAFSFIVLSGSASVQGSPRYGEVLSVSAAPVPANAAYSVLWMSGNTALAVSDTLLLTAEHIGKDIYAVLSGNGIFDGSITTASVHIRKALAAAPASNAVRNELTPDSVSFTLPGGEFRTENGSWDTAATFEAQPGTSYVFFVRYAETPTHEASPELRVTVKTPQRPSDEIASSVYTVTDIEIGGIAPGTTVSELLAALDSTAFLSVSGKSNTEAVITGDSLQVIQDGSVARSYTIVLSGDCDRNGDVNAEDLRALRLGLAGKAPLPDLICADINRDGAITATDYILLSRSL